MAPKKSAARLPESKKSVSKKWTGPGNQKKVQTKSAFFDNRDRPVYRNPAPGWWRNPANQSNKYGDGYQSYDYQYMATQGPSFVDPPT